jgi:hypothetical protein
MSAEPSAKKRGPKPKGILKVVYYRRVTPEQKLQLDDLLDGKLPVAATSPDPQVAALLDNVDRLTKEVEVLNVRLDKCARATDGQKGAYWKAMYDGLVAKSAPVSDYDQTRS